MQVTALRSSAGFAPVLRRHSLLIGFVCVFGAISLTLTNIFGAKVDTYKTATLMWNFVRMLPSMLYFVLFARFIYMRQVIKPDNPLQWFKADIKAAVTDRHRLMSGALATVLMFLTLVFFAQLKRLVPIITPFSWDETFMALDQALHFGTHPHEIAHALLGHPLVITAATGAYNLWLFLLYFVLLATCFYTGNPRLRMQYLVAFLLTWAFGGNLLAILLSSAGPVYYARLGLGDTYAPLMELLRLHASTSPISVLESQEILWQFYTDTQSVNGISAMPSMHVASSVLMAAYAFRFGRGPGLAFSAFAGMIMLGSVLLGWHYAVDGYVGALVALTAWKLSGWIVAQDRWQLAETRNG
jgi:PAP2 superfamily